MPRNQLAGSVRNQLQYGVHPLDAAGWFKKHIVSDSIVTTVITGIFETIYEPIKYSESRNGFLFVDWTQTPARHRTNNGKGGL